MLSEGIEVKKPKTEKVVGTVVNTVLLNVRSTVSLTSEIVTILDKGDEVEIDTGFKDPEWLKLKKPVKGYVVSKYIATKEPK